MPQAGTPQHNDEPGSTMVRASPCLRCLRGSGRAVSGACGISWWILTTAWGPVETRGGCGAGWGPCACPGGNAIHWGLRGAPQRGQAQGPLIHSTPPLVPTGPWAASTSMDRIPRFGRQHSL